MRRLAVATIAVLVALTVSASLAFANWPTTCIEANDAFEYSAGRLQNVGIYQRVFPDAAEAEAACQRDHRADIQTAFAWAMDAQAPASTPTPDPAPAVDPTTHPDYDRVWQVAYNRSDDATLAATIAADVIGRGAIDPFLRGTDDGVQYGRWHCEWRNAECPLAPEEPPPSEPFIEAGLQHAWDLMVSTGPGGYLVETAPNPAVTIRWDHTLSGNKAARYRASTHTIWISASLRSERPAVLAAVLAHEFWHASSPIPCPRTFDQCVADELWAITAEVTVWADLRPDWNLRTPLERTFQAAADALADDLALGLAGSDDWEDLSAHPNLRAHVLYDRGYATICAA